MSRIGKLAGAILTGGVISFAFASTADAVVIDLVYGNTGTSNGTIYNWVDQQSTGTGVIEPFLRIQRNGTEQGYNNSCCTNDPWDTKSGIWTHDLLLSDLVTKIINGVGYYEFLLDINQNRGGDGQNQLLSLNNVQIFTRVGAISTAPDDFSQLGTLRYNNDVGVDTTVELDYGRNPGSGAGDMLMYIPVSFFALASATDYVYFYSSFGIPHGTNDGFEEWALLAKPRGTAPEPASLSLVGLGLALAAWRMRRRV